MATVNKWSQESIWPVCIRVLKEGDEEVSGNGDSCVVCFELYKPNDTIQILTCKHFFHKNCIDPLILAHGTCPMCKCDILKALGIQVDVEDGTESLQVLMSNELADIPSSSEEGTNNELPPSGRSKWHTWRQRSPSFSGRVGRSNSVAADIHPSPWHHGLRGSELNLFVKSGPNTDKQFVQTVIFVSFLLLLLLLW